MLPVRKNPQPMFVPVVELCEAMRMIPGNVFAGVAASIRYQKLIVNAPLRSCSWRYGTTTRRPVPGLLADCQVKPNAEPNRPATQAGVSFPPCSAPLAAFVYPAVSFA